LPKPAVTGRGKDTVYVTAKSAAARALAGPGPYYGAAARSPVNATAPGPTAADWFLAIRLQIW